MKDYDYKQELRSEVYNFLNGLVEGTHYWDIRNRVMQIFDKYEPQPKPTQYCECVSTIEQFVKTGVWLAFCPNCGKHKPLKKECEHESGIGKNGICIMCGKPDNTGNKGESYYGFMGRKPKPTQDEMTPMEKMCKRIVKIDFSKPLKKECDDDCPFCEPKPERIELTELRKWMDEFEDRFCKIIINHLTRGKG